MPVRSAPAIPEPRPQWTPTDVLAIVARRAQPLLPLWLYGGTEAYLLLTLFDLCLGLVAIPMVAFVRSFAFTVSDSLAGTIDQRATACAVMAALAAVFVVPFGMPLVFLGAVAHVDWRAVLGHPGFWASAAVVVLLATRGILMVPRAGDAPGATLHYASAQRGVALQMGLLVGFYLLALALTFAGRTGMLALPVLFSGLLVVHDLRPDVVLRMWPER